MERKPRSLRQEQGKVGAWRISRPLSMSRLAENFLNVSCAILRRGGHCVPPQSVSEYRSRRIDRAVKDSLRSWNMSSSWPAENAEGDALQQNVVPTGNWAILDFSSSNVPIA